MKISLAIVALLLQPNQAIRINRPWEKHVIEWKPRPGEAERTTPPLKPYKDDKGSHSTYNMTNRDAELSVEILNDAINAKNKTKFLPIPTPPGNPLPLHNKANWGDGDRVGNKESLTISGSKNRIEKFY